MSNEVGYVKKWQILLNIIFEVLIFLIINIALIIAVPKLLGFFWPFVASWIIAIVASPLCGFLEKHIKLKKRWSSAIIIVLVVLIVALLGYLLVAKIGGELFEFMKNSPKYYRYVQNALSAIGKKLGGPLSTLSPEIGTKVSSVFTDLLSAIKDAVNNFAPKAVGIMGSAAGSITNGFIGVVVMIVAAYFFIADKDVITEKLLGILPPDTRKKTEDLKNRMGEALGGFLKAQFKIMFVIMIILLVSLIIMGNPYALFLALLIAFLDLLPILGTGTVLIPWAIIEIVQANYTNAVIMAITYVVCLFTRQLLQPKIIGDSIGMGTMPTLFLIYTGFKLSGMKGMILALLIGVIYVALYKLGVFDNKRKKLNRLILDYKACSASEDPGDPEE